MEAQSERDLHIVTEDQGTEGLFEVMKTINQILADVLGSVQAVLNYHRIMDQIAGELSVLEACAGIVFQGNGTADRIREAELHRQRNQLTGDAHDKIRANGKFKELKELWAKIS